MTMRDVNHTHPHTGEPFGFRFGRSHTVAADGGEEATEPDEETMADVSHGSHEGADRAFERGTEGRVQNE